MAVNGDTVLVAPGTYSENLDFLGKAITVTSGAHDYADAGATILNGVGKSPTVWFHKGETHASILNGFTIQNGQTTAIDIEAGPTISNNDVVDNANCALVIAGASASPLIQNNRIARTTLPKTGSQSCSSSTAGVVRGVGVNVVHAGSDVILSRNLIEANVGSDTGGSIGAAILALQTSSLTLQNNTIRNNIGPNGVGLFARDVVKLALIQNLIYGNESLVRDPQGGTYPGGIAGVEIDHDPYLNLPETVEVVGNTIVGNYSYGKGAYGNTRGGEQIDFGEQVNSFIPFTSVKVENNLFISLENNAAAFCALFSSTAITWNNNDVFNEGPPLGASSCTPTNAVVAGNLQIDPQFIDPTGIGDFHTNRTSPVVAAGTINAPDIPATDLDAKNRTVCGTIDMGVYEVHPQPPITLTSSQNPSSGGSSVTFSVHLTGNCNTPTGIVTFLDAGSVLGTGTLDSAGNATFTTAGLTVGNHNTTATYPGDFNFDANTSNVLVQVVTGYPTSTVLTTVAPNPAQALQTVTVSAVVSSPFSNLAGIPTGTVTFLAGASPIGSAALDSRGVASTTVSSLSPGTYSITAVYNPTPIYATSTSAAVAEVVNGAATTTTLLSLPNPSTYDQTVTFTAKVAAAQSASVPSGSVTFYDGSAPLGSAVISTAGSASFSTSLLSVGSHTITASYAGSAIDNASTSSGLVQLVNLAPTTVTLKGTPNPADVGTLVTVFATVNATLGGLPPPGGSIVFADQFGSLGAVAISNGQATFTSSSFGAGTHHITATFATSGNFAASSSAILDEVIQPHDFSISLTPATLEIASGQTGQVKIMVSALGSFAGTLTLSADQVPAYALVTFKPVQLSVPPGANSSSALSVATASLPVATAFDNDLGRPSAEQTILAAMAFTALPVMFFRRRRLKSLLKVLVITGTIFSIAGCSNIYYPLNRVAPGTYLIPITATDAATNAIHTVNLTLIVSP